MLFARLGPVWLGAVLSCAALACSDPANAKEGGAQPNAATAPRQVRLVRVEAQRLAKVVTVTGTLAPEAQVTAGVKVAGRLASVEVDIGTVVTRGQVIARIEPTDFALRVEQAASAVAQARAQLGLSLDGSESEVQIDETSLVREAQATLDEKRAYLERLRGLVADHLVTPAEFDAARAADLRAETAVAAARDEIRNRQAALRQRTFELHAARQQLADAVVRAPLAGIVQERYAQTGEYLAAGASVALIVQVDPLRMRAEVPERDAQLVRHAQAVAVTVEGDPTEHSGTLVRLAPALTEQSRSLVVEAEIANNGRLRPGSFVRVQIVVDAADEVLVVPQTAIVTFAGIEKVLTVESNTVVEKPIATGRRTENWTEIVSGIAAGTAVIAQPGNLQQGQPVAVTGP
jgi:RND family efflux transporter MFP subunit